MRRHLSLPWLPLALFASLFGTTNSAFAWDAAPGVSSPRPGQDIDALLRKVEQQVNSGHAMSPAQDSAMETWKQVLQTERSILISPKVQQAVTDLIVNMRIRAVEERTDGKVAQANDVTAFADVADRLLSLPKAPIGPVAGAQDPASSPASAPPSGMSRPPSGQPAPAQQAPGAGVPAKAPAPAATAVADALARAALPSEIQSASSGSSPNKVPPLPSAVQEALVKGAQSTGMQSSGAQPVVGYPAGKVAPAAKTVSPSPVAVADTTDRPPATPYPHAAETMAPAGNPLAASPVAEPYDLASKAAPAGASPDAATPSTGQMALGQPPAVAAAQPARGITDAPIASAPAAKAPVAQSTATATQVSYVQPAPAAPTQPRKMTGDGAAANPLPPSNVPAPMIGGVSASPPPPTEAASVARAAPVTADQTGSMPITVAANIPRAAAPAESPPLPQASSQGPVSPVVAALMSESAGKAPPPPRAVTPDDYIRWGSEMLAVNDVPDARRFFGYAAIAGSERGAILLAQTYGQAAAETAAAMPQSNQASASQAIITQQGAVQPVSSASNEWPRIAPVKEEPKPEPEWMALKASAASPADRPEAATRYPVQSAKQRLARRHWYGSSHQAQAKPPWYSVLSARLRTITR